MSYSIKNSIVKKHVLKKESLIMVGHVNWNTYCLSRWHNWVLWDNEFLWGNNFFPLSSSFLDDVLVWSVQKVYRSFEWCCILCSYVIERIKLSISTNVIKTYITWSNEVLNLLPDIGIFSKLNDRCLLVVWLPFGP